MPLFFPRTQPATIALLFIAFVICELFGGDSDGGITYAIAPIIGGGLIAGAMVGSSIIGGVQKARAKRQALRRYLNSPEFKALSAAQKQAALRSKKQEYGLSDAAMRKMAREAGLQYKGMTGQLSAELRGDRDPTTTARSREQLAQVVEGATDTSVRATGAAQDVSSQVASGQRAADLNLIKGAAAQRQATETGKAAIAGEKIDTITGGIQQVGQVALPLLATAASQPGPRADAAQTNIPATPKAPVT